MADEVIEDSVDLKVERLSGGGTQVRMNGIGPRFGGAAVSFIAHTDTVERLGLNDGVETDDVGRVALAARAVLAFITEWAKEEGVDLTHGGWKDDFQ